MSTSSRRTSSTRPLASTNLDAQLGKLRRNGGGVVGQSNRGGMKFPGLLQQFFGLGMARECGHAVGGPQMFDHLQRVTAD